MAIAKEQIRQIITENNFTNVADVYAYKYQKLFYTAVYLTRDTSI